MSCMVLQKQLYINGKKMLATRPHLFTYILHLVHHLMHYFFFGLFSYPYTFSVTVLTLWVTPPEMSYNWYRI